LGSLNYKSSNIFTFVVGVTVALSVTDGASTSDFRSFNREYQMQNSKHYSLLLEVVILLHSEQHQCVFLDKCGCVAYFSIFLSVAMVDSGEIQTYVKFPCSIFCSTKGS